MATIIETIERDGDQIAIYDNGMQRNVTKGKLIHGPTSTLITKENARAIAQKRQEKAARLLRKQIRDATAENLQISMKSSAEAIAVTGGMLWQDVVLNKDSYDRDRIEAFTKLGQISGVIPTPSHRDEPEKNSVAVAATVGAAVATAMAQILADVLQAQQQIHAQSADVIDVDAD